MSESENEFNEKKVEKQQKENVDASDPKKSQKQLKFKEKFKKMFWPLIGGATIILASTTSIILALKSCQATEKASSTFTVSFDTDGGTIVRDQQIVINNYAIKPTPPTKSGFEFVEWHTEDGSLFDFNNQKITKNIQLKAIWKKVDTSTYVVSFKCGTNGKFISGETTFESSSVTVNKGSIFSSFAKPNVKPNDGYIWNGWIKNGILITDESFSIESDEEFTASYLYDTTKADVYLSDEVLDTTCKINGQTILSVDKHSTFGSIKETLPVAQLTITPAEGQTIEVAFQHWSLTMQTEKDVIPPVCPDTEELTNGITLYPAFSFKVEDITQIVTLNIKLTGEQIAVGDVTKIEVPYKPSAIKKFSDVIKPQVIEDVLVFDGYYHDESYTNAWTNDEEILPTMSNTDIYVKFKPADDDVIITFDKSDVTVGEETKPVTYVGSTSVKCPLNTILSTIAPSCYWNASPDPDAKVKYYSECYFDYWSYTDSDGQTEVKIDSPNNFFIEKAIVLKPHFLKKPILTFYLNEDEEPAAEKIVEIKYVPSENSVWSDLNNIPTADNKEVAGENWLFAGWKVKLLTEETESIVTPSTLLSDIDNSQPVKPAYTNKCHKITFTETALIDGVEKTCVLVGNKTIGVEFKTSSEEVINVQNEINKPAFPTSPITPGAPETSYNKNLMFNNQWQIKGGAFGETWTDVTNETEIPGAEPQQEYTLRPVATSKFTLYYKTDTSKGKFVGTDPAPVSEDTDQATVGEGQVFSSVYQPTIQVQDGWEFSEWNDSPSGTGVSYSPDELISRPATGDLILYAQYKANTITTSVKYHIFEDELNDEDYPADAISTDNTFTASITSSKDTTSVKYKEFVRIAANRKYFDFLGWGYEDANGAYTRGGKKYSLITAETNIPAQTRLDLYAIFEMGETKYTKFTIASKAKTTVKGQPSSYTIVGEHKFFAKIGEKMPFNATTKQVQDFDIFVYAVGYEVDYWIDSDGKKLEGAVENKDYLDIVPMFKASTRTISFELKPTDISDGVKFTSTGGTTYNQKTYLPYYDNLLSYIEGKNKSKLTLPKISSYGKTIESWQIKKTVGKTVKYEDIKSDTVIDANIVLVPNMVGESMFTQGAYPYYYDKSKSDWYQIYDCAPVSKIGYIYVRRFVNSQYTYEYIAKSTFNYQVLFPTLLEKVPDNFMYGCTTWNNGGKSLSIPNTVTEIGSNFMHGCSAFNQPIAASNSGFTGGSLKIGANFMKKCYSFNQPTVLSLAPTKSNGTIYLSDGFMDEMTSFTGNELCLYRWTNWYFVDSLGNATKYNPSASTTVKEEFAKNFNHCLTTTFKNRGTITIRVNNDQITNFKTMFPNLSYSATTPCYRTLGVRN